MTKSPIKGKKKNMQIKNIFFKYEKIKLLKDYPETKHSIVTFQ